VQPLDPLSADRLGQAAIGPGEPVVAGSWATLRFTYTAGHPIDDTGYVKIVFRTVGDFGQPQFFDPAAPNYFAVHSTGDCRIEPRWDPKGHTRPWDCAIYLQVRGGYLDTGQSIEVVCGDRSGGSPGWQMQTFCEDTFEFKTLIDPIATYEFKELPQSPTLRIVPGEPERAICIAPSQVVAGRSFTYHVKLEDRWGNPVGEPRAMTHSGFDRPVLNRPGVRTLRVTDGTTGLAAQSNPIDVLAVEPPRHVYWADLHGQSEETVGTNSIDDYFTFARDVALVDVAAHQGNDFQVTDAFWQTVNDVTRVFDEAGRFVTFPGYEWSGNTPLGGDRNVYFSREGGAIVHSCADLLPGKRSAYATALTAVELFETLAEQEGPQAFAFAHVGGRYADLRMHDPDVELAVEVHSAWGTFEWLVEDALQRGYRIGVCANSDGHKGRPGASYPGARKFGSYGGLTCVLATRLDRESVLEALRARHFYATTGQRCLLDVRLDRQNGTQAMMGDVVPVDERPPRLYVRVVGTAPIERIEVRNGLELINIFRLYSEEDLRRRASGPTPTRRPERRPGHSDDTSGVEGQCRMSYTDASRPNRSASDSGWGSGRIKILWSGAEVRGRARMVAWDGQLCVRGNALVGVTPINFWSPDHQPEVGGDCVSWRSVTTGGVAGIILTLKEPNAGMLELTTAQRKVSCPIGEIGVGPRVWDCGGLRKRIDVYRLPDPLPFCGVSFRLPLHALHEGDNPIYAKVVQEDGHMAWASPLYLVR
jgi:hypothetical protein